jgi:hypothetical protein
LTFGDLFAIITGIHMKVLPRSSCKILSIEKWLKEEQDEHGHGKWEGKQKGKSDKRITESKARQKESTTL